MALTTFYFQLHQPFRLHIDRGKFLWDEKNREAFNDRANQRYIPATLMFTELLRAYPDFKMTLGMSGTFLKQAEEYRPEVIRHLQALYDAGKNRHQVEILDETYYHSLTSLFSDPEKKEFRQQVSMHRQAVQDIFGASPTAFRNTDLIYDNEIAAIVADMGYRAILCDEVQDKNAVFRARGKEKGLGLLVLSRNKGLSEDIHSRFQDNPISAEEYANRLSRENGEVVLLGCDYEHIGRAGFAEKGIFDFWINLPGELAKHENIIVANPSEIVERLGKREFPVLDVPKSSVSWSEVQEALFRDLEQLEEEARKSGVTDERWRYLTISDQISNVGENPMSAYLLTRKIYELREEIKAFSIHKKTQKTPVVIVSPEIAKLPSEGMGEFAKYVSGKSGGMGEMVSALCGGLIERGIPVHLITLNLRGRFMEEAGMGEEEWIKTRHEMHPENIHLVSSSLFDDNRSAYDNKPLETAAEFQRQIINTYIKEIRSKYGRRAILHTHDWMAGGAVVAYAKLRGMPVLHTVHNTHTGYIPVDFLDGAGLRRFEENLYFCWDNGRYCIDSHATAIKSASKVSYVGKRFLEEVIRDYFSDRPVIPPNVREETKIKYRFGSALAIPNGIPRLAYPENQEENPEVDKPGLAKKYSAGDNVVKAKRLNLAKFQKRTGLAQNPDAILLYWPSRLDSFQKGIHLLENLAQRFVDAHPDVQIAVVGDGVGGDKTHEEIMGRIACASKGKIVYYPFDEDLSLLGYAAASDVFGASLYEPFGQIDVVGNLYGATATNRDTGGYRDKITPLQLRAWGAPNDIGNGVLFKEYNEQGLWWGLSESVKNHRFFRRNPAKWEKQMKRIMREASEKHSLDNMIAGCIQVYEELNEGRPLA